MTQTFNFNIDIVQCIFTEKLEVDKLGNLKIVGLGPGDLRLLTVEAYQLIESSEKLYFRTSIHPVYDYFAKNKEINHFDDIYKICDDFEEVYEEIANRLYELLKENDVIYCVPGNPKIDDNTLFCGKLAGYKDYELYSGISYADEALKYVDVDLNNINTMNFFDVRKSLISVHNTNVILNSYNVMLAEELSITLSEIYGDEYEIIVVFYTGEKAKEYYKKVKIMELIQLKDYNHQAVIIVPESKENKIYQISDLLLIMEKLRGIDGCSWDLEQTHESLRNNLLEESYEVVEAINNMDMENLEEELGDVLLQVVFHAQIANEEGYFDFDNVVNGISEKMVRRHPHVFDKKDDINTDEVSNQWENIKDKEKNVKNYTERLRNISKVLPSLVKSYKIQKKVSKIGFDWQDIQGPINKLKEELNEFLVEFEIDNAVGTKEEIGDLLFSIVNVCRFLDIDPEEALNATNEKFIKRFSYLEQKALEDGLKLENMTLEEMDTYWESSKLSINQQS